MSDTFISKHQFPANVPQKLIELFFDQECNFSALSRRLDVNKNHVWSLLVKGEEPKDPAIRAKLFLPGKVRKPVPAWIGQATNVLADLEAKATPKPNRTYTRQGKRFR